MAMHTVTLETLKHLDMGKATEAFSVHLRRAVLDCLDRPGEKAAREVMLKVRLEPVMESDGSCDECKAQLFVTSKVPTHRTKVYSFGTKRTGAIFFNEDSPESIDQTTMFADEESES